MLDQDNASSENTTIRASITNQGIGIPEAELEKSCHPLQYKFMILVATKNLLKRVCKTKQIFL